MCEYIKMIQKLLKSRNIKNSLWVIGEQIFQMIISLIISALSARYLGPGNYGSLNYTASFVTFFMSIATLGMEGVVVKKLVDHPEKEGRYLGGCMMLRLASSLLSILSICILIIVLNPGDMLKLVMALLQSMQLMFRAVQILDSWFQRHLKSKYVSIGKMIACLTVSAYKIYLLATSKSILWFAASNALSDCVIAVVLFVFYQKEKNQVIRVDLKCGIDTLKDSYHFILSGLMVAIYSQMDKIMIGQMLTDQDVGLYSTATLIAGMWIFVPTAIINSFRPMIMEMKKSGNEENYLLRLKQLYSAIIWLCLFVSTVVAIGGKYIILLLYGDAYVGATSALRIAIWFETFAMIGTCRGIWVLCENKAKYVKYYLGIGAVVNLVLNAVLIPLMGIDGAALATLLTQITTSIIAPMFFKETRIHTQIVFEAFAGLWLLKRR